VRLHCGIAYLGKIVKDAVTEWIESGQNNQDSKVASPTHVVTQMPPAPGNQTIAERNREYRLEIARYRLERRAYRVGKVTLLVLAVYTFFNYKLYSVTKDEFHFTNRALITFEQPTFDATSVPFPLVVIGLQNVGRSPSGAVDTIIHEAISNQPFGVFGQGIDINGLVRAKVATAYESHCEKFDVAPMGFNTPPIGMSVHLIGLGSGPAPFGDFGDTAVIAGRSVFTDGFSDDPMQGSLFCFWTVFKDQKMSNWNQCDPVLIIPALEQKDDDPKCEKQPRIGWGSLF
jgi:hypothetical protein